MNTNEYMSAGSKILFFLLVFWGIRTGDLFGIVLSLVGFLIIEHLIADLEE